MSRQTDEYEVGSTKTTQAGTAKKKKSYRARQRKKRKIMIFATEVMVLLVVILGLYGITQWDKIQKPSFSKEDVQTNDIDESVLKAMEGYSTYALFGVDARNNTQLDKGNRSDTIIIASVNHDTGDVKLVSIFRDTYLCVDDDGKMGKINGAYNTGGALNAINMLNKNFDLEIDGYATVNWYALASTIDLLGGIEIDVPDEILHHPTKGNMLNGYIIETVESTGINSVGVDTPGLQTLNGIQSVAYSRIRYVKGGDYTRAEHQREVLGKMFDKAKHMSLSQLKDIMDEVLPNIQTNVEISEALSVASHAAKYNIIMGDGFPFTKNNAIMPGNLGDVVVPLNLIDNVTQLHEILYDSGESYKPSSTVQSLNSKVASDTTPYLKKD